MSELGNQMVFLRKKKQESAGKQRGFSQVDVASGAKVSLRTYARIEDGYSVKLSTLNQILQFLKPSPEEKVSIMISWIKLELGDELFDQVVQHLTKSPSLVLKGDPSAMIVKKFKQLKHAEQEELMKVLNSPQLIRCLPFLNQMRANAER